MTSKSLFMKIIMRSKALNSGWMPLRHVACLSLVSCPIPFNRVDERPSRTNQTTPPPHTHTDAHQKKKRKANSSSLGFSLWYWFCCSPSVHVKRSMLRCSTEMSQKCTAIRTWTILSTKRHFSKPSIISYLSHILSKQFDIYRFQESGQKGSGSACCQANPSEIKGVDEAPSCGEIAGFLFWQGWEKEHTLYHSSGENNIEKVIGITDNALKALLFLLHSSWRDAFLSETSASDKVAWLSLHNACVDETPERTTMPAVTDISVCHMAASQHTDTATCSDGLTQRWEQFSERASVVVKTNRRGTRNHVFWFISHICNKPRHLFFYSFFYLLANRWQCNIKYETGVLKLPYI